MALLGGRRGLPVWRDFRGRRQEKALGQEVMGSLSPGQALVGIVNRSWLPPWARALPTSTWRPSPGRDPDGRPAGRGQDHHHRQKSWPST